MSSRVTRRISSRMGNGDVWCRRAAQLWLCSGKVPSSVSMFLTPQSHGARVARPSLAPGILQRFRCLESKGVLAGFCRAKASARVDVPRAPAHIFYSRRVPGLVAGDQKPLVSSPRLKSAAIGRYDRVFEYLWFSRAPIPHSRNDGGSSRQTKLSVGKDNAEFVWLGLECLRLNLWYKP